MHCVHSVSLCHFRRYLITGKVVSNAVSNTGNVKNNWHRKTKVYESAQKAPFVLVEVILC